MHMSNWPEFFILGAVDQRFTAMFLTNNLGFRWLNDFSLPCCFQLAWQVSRWRLLHPALGYPCRRWFCWPSPGFSWWGSALAVHISLQTWDCQLRGPLHFDGMWSYDKGAPRPRQRGHFWGRTMLPSWLHHTSPKAILPIKYMWSVLYFLHIIRIKYIWMWVVCYIVRYILSISLYELVACRSFYLLVLASIKQY